MPRFPAIQRVAALTRSTTATIAGARRHHTGSRRIALAIAAMSAIVLGGGVAAPASASVTTAEGSYCDASAHWGYGGYVEGYCYSADTHYFRVDISCQVSPHFWNLYHDSWQVVGGGVWSRAGCPNGLLLAGYLITFQ
jgi:hypothetical protein